MRLLFDQGTPVPLRRHLPAHDVATAYEQGWSTLQNRELISQAEAGGFEVLVTTDSNLKYQQTIEGRRLGCSLDTSSIGPKAYTHWADTVGFAAIPPVATHS